MPASTADAGTLEVTELEEMFSKDLTCETDGCDSPARFLVTAIPCQHSIKLCAYHKIREVKGFEFDYPSTYCHQDRDLLVTELKVTDL